MIYKSFLPGAALSAFIRNYTIIDFSFTEDQQVPNKQRPPKPEQGLVFYIKGSVSIRNTKTGMAQTPPPVSIFSNQVDKKDYVITPRFLILTVFFRPGVLHRLLKLPIVELDQDFHDAELFFGKELFDIMDRLADAKDYPRMIQIVETFLWSKCKDLIHENNVDRIANQLLQDPNLFTLDSLAKEACLSTKQFYRRFKERIGITPKFFSRLIRFNSAYQYKMAHPGVKWSSIALQFDYTDYHHMEKEFKEFTGLTPQQWMHEDQAAPERILKLR